MLELELIVMFINFGTNFNFLDLHNRLFFLRFMRSFLLLIAKLAIIHQFTDWRVGVRRNLNEIQCQSFSFL